LIAAAQRTLLLFDVDGVLIHPVGYKAALRALVDRFAAQMGQSPMGPDDDEIAIFEACGFTNEWDSGAVCISAILLAALAQRPDVRRGSLDDTFEAIRAARISVARPDFVGIVREVFQQHADGHFPAARYLDMLAARLNDGALALARDLLGSVYDVIHTPTTRAFQTLTLGSARFAAVYGQPAPFESESYLTRYDIPLLSETDRLLDWLRGPGRGAAIFTARPSLAPADLADAPVAVLTGYAPEAELAVELLGLAGKVPLIGQGRVAWLAERYGRGVGDYVKPSPVQGLAAIGAAASGTETDALNAAAALYEHGDLSGPLAALRGYSTQVIVFEDSTGGIRATRHAADRLMQAGLDVRFRAVGVSPNADKRAALAAVADHVVDDVNAGLALVYGA
jgi:phosphoglycolate phosphatase-like HAD superfamily hydrolase